MDGITLSRGLNKLLQESNVSDWLDSYATYSWLYQAATEFVARTQCLTSSQTITTVAGTRNYLLNADFLKLYLKDSQDREYIKYATSSATTFIYPRHYQEMIYANRTTNVLIPDGFCIRDYSTAQSNLTSITSSAGAYADGETVLNKVGATFLASVSVNDRVRNITTAAHGVVLSVTSDIALATALFDGSDSPSSDWGSGDTYLIFPQGRLELYLDPPPSTSSHTITVYYVQKPNPVFSPQRTYRIKPEYAPALIQYAAYLYKYRDQQPNFGDAWYKYFNEQVRKFNNDYRQAVNRGGFSVSFRKAR